MNFFTYIYQGFWLDFKLLFIVLFLGIISWRGVSCFNGGICFSDGRASFLSWGMPHRGASVLIGGFSKKIAGWGSPPLMPPPPPPLPPPHYGKPCICWCKCKTCIFHWIFLGFPSSLVLSVKNKRWFTTRHHLLNGRNLFSVTKAIWWSPREKCYLVRLQAP